MATHEKENRLVAAVCAAPTALLAHGVFKGKRVTSYPAFKGKLETEYEYSEAEVERMTSSSSSLTIIIRWRRTASW